MGEEEEKIEENPKSLCDFCNESKPIIYCRADSARLCLSCDRHVHRANSVSSKHSRSLLCNSCSSAPSSILCSSHGRVLCSNCDFEAHVGTAHHERRPVEWFCGCPSGVELGLALGFGANEELLLEKEKEKKRCDFDEGDENEGSWVWETPQFVRLDELIGGDSSNHGLKAMGVPPLPKNRNLACGEQKEEVRQQLRELIKSESQLSTDCEEGGPVTEFQFLLQESNDQPENFHSDFDANATFTVAPNFESNELQWNNDNWHNAIDPLNFAYDQEPVNFSVTTTPFPEGASDFNTSSRPTASSNGDTLHPNVAESLPQLAPKLGLEILCPDRDSVISRYKEKRKARRYDKLIRYESRKARADSRLRIRGRFAKGDQMPNS